MADELLVEKVLRAVELVPAGRIASYGDIAAIVGIGPRHVGNVMAQWGADVAWWRITNAAGELPAHLLNDARRRWADEGIQPTQNGRGCRIARHRADIGQLARAWEQATRDLAVVPDP